MLYQCSQTFKKSSFSGESERIQDKFQRRIFYSQVGIMENQHLVNSKRWYQRKWTTSQITLESRDLASERHLLKRAVDGLNVQQLALKAGIA